MVNADHVKRKLPSLLCNGSTTDKKEWAKRHRIEIGLKRLRKLKPTKYQNLASRLIFVLKEMEMAALEKSESES
jgi:hypothetical protein